MFNWFRRSPEATTRLLLGIIDKKVDGLHEEVKSLTTKLQVLEILVSWKNKQEVSLDRAYRDCMNRVTEVALGMSGHTELAERFRAHSGATERVQETSGFSSVSEMNWEDVGGEQWPGKGYVALDSRG